MTLDSASAASDNRTLDSAWHGAEAFHFWLLAHRQLSDGDFESAMRTALHLRKFEDVIDAKEIYSFLALAAFYAQFYAQCSKAFIKLESMKEFTEAKREEYADLALSIFVKNQPIDPKGLRETRGDNWRDQDPLLGKEREEVCVASGKTIRDPNHVRCKTCKHVSILGELKGRRSCPLCHSELPNYAGGTAPAASSGGALLGRQTSSNASANKVNGSKVNGNKVNGNDRANNSRDWSDDEDDDEDIIE
jgi:WD repeat-containing protein 35